LGTCTVVISQTFFLYANFFFSSRRGNTRSKRDWSSDVCSSDLEAEGVKLPRQFSGCPLKEALRRLPGYLLSHILHAVTPRSRPGPTQGSRPSGLGEVAARRTPAGFGRTPPG